MSGPEDFVGLTGLQPVLNLWCKNTLDSFFHRLSCIDPSVASTPALMLQRTTPSMGVPTSVEVGSFRKPSTNRKMASAVSVLPSAPSRQEMRRKNEVSAAYAAHVATIRGQLKDRNHQMHGIGLIHPTESKFLPCAARHAAGRTPPCKHDHVPRASASCTYIIFR